MWHTLKQSSDRSKKIYALVIAGIVTGTIVYSWVHISLPVILGHRAEQTVIEEHASSPFQAMRSYVTSFPHVAADAIEHMRDSFTASSALEGTVRYEAN